MKSVRAQAISHANIAPYGSLFDLAEPDGFSFKGENHAFFPDRLPLLSSELSISGLSVTCPLDRLVKAMEMHRFAEEILLPVDADVVIHVAPPTPERPDTDLAEAFVVPCGTAVKLNPGVWHLAPMPVDAARAQVMIILPQRCYAEDLTLVELDEEERFVIQV